MRGARERLRRRMKKYAAQRSEACNEADEPLRADL